MADETLKRIGTEEPVGGIVIRRTASTANGAGAGGGPVDKSVESRINRARSAGRPLDGDTRAEMEAGFREDLSSVRIHTGGEADTLSRMLNARAFTTGRDIFFGGSGTPDRRVLAHEIAHTLQDRGEVRRFVSPADFAKMTDQGTFTMKGTAQKKIEKYLGEYYALTGKKGDAAVWANPIIPEPKIPAALQLLELMHLTVDGWLTAHSKSNEDGTRGAVELNRAKRGSGMVKFDDAVQHEKIRLEALQNIATEGEDVKATEATKFDTRADKIKKKFTGNLTEGFSTASTAMGLLLTHDGESTEFVLDVTIPVGGPGYVSVTMEFDIRKETNVELGLNLKVGAGAKVPNVADVRAAIGGFVKSSGRDVRAAMDLAKYGIYRRLRESKAVPRELANKIWGGDSGKAGYEQGEKWSRQIEEKHLGQQGSFVETGGLVEGKVHVGADSAGAGLTAQYQSGTRHDKRSIESAKGKLGAENKRAGNTSETADGSKRGEQMKTGRAVENIRLAGEINLGPFKGQLIFDWSYRAPESTAKKTDFSAIEVQLNLRLSLPIDDLASTIVSMLAGMTTAVKSKVQKFRNESLEQWKKKSGTNQAKDVVGFVVPVLLTGNNIANAVSFDKAGVPWDQWAQGITKEAATNKSAASTALKTLSKVGLEIGMRLRGDIDDKETGLLELRHVTELDAALPTLLKVQLTRKARLGAAKWNGSGWDASL
jgi:hypothetical protein